MRLIFDLKKTKKKTILTKLLTKPELGTAPAPACLYFLVISKIPEFGTAQLS